MNDHLDKARAFFQENMSTDVRSLDPRVYRLNAGLFHLTAALDELSKRFEAQGAPIGMPPSSSEE